MIAKANANGDTESANVWNNMSNEQLAEAYNAAWSSAFASGNTSEIKSLMDYSTARVSPGYAAKLVDPSVGETGGTKPIEFKIGEEAPSYGQRIDRNSMFGTVLFNHNARFKARLACLVSYLGLPATQKIFRFIDKRKL